MQAASARARGDETPRAASDEIRVGRECFMNASCGDAPAARRVAGGPFATVRKVNRRGARPPYAVWHFADCHRKDETNSEVGTLNAELRKGVGCWVLVLVRNNQHLKPKTFFQFIVPRSAFIVSLVLFRYFVGRAGSV